MDFSIKINETNQSFYKKVLVAVCEELTTKFLLIHKRIEKDVAAAVIPILKASEGYNILTTDEIVIADLGMPVGSMGPRLDTIIQKISDSVEVSFSPFYPQGNNIKGGITIGILIADYSDILKLPESHLEIVTKLGEKFDIQWLLWILTMGSATINNKYHVFYKASFGRSKAGHMELSGSWRVDSKIRGWPNSNFLTKALTSDVDKLSESLESTIINSIERNL